MMHGSMFEVGDKAVYPAHGVGEVTGIEARDVGGANQSFYVLRILDNGMKVMIPTAATGTGGLREIMNTEEVEEVFGVLRAGRQQLPCYVHPLRPVPQFLAKLRPHWHVYACGCGVRAPA